MDYGERIRNYRVSASLTQQQLADKIGVSRQSVARWESGWNTPSLYCAQKLADCFGVTVATLMSGDDNSPDVANSAPPAKAQTPDIFASTIMFCVLAFLPIIIMQIAFNVIYLSPWLMRQTFDLLYQAIASVCGVSLAVLGVWWIVRIIDCFRKTTDKFLRYRLYRTWNIGLAFLLVNIITYVASVNPVIGFPVVLLFFGAAFIAVPLDFIIDSIIKKILAEKMIVTHNKALKIINLVYTILAAALIALLAGYIAFALIVWGPTALLAVGFAVLYFLGGAIIIDVSYIIVRIAVGIHTRKAMSDNDKPD